MGTFAGIKVTKNGTATKLILNKAGFYSVTISEIETKDSKGDNGKQKIQLFTVKGKNTETGNDFQFTGSDFELYDEILAYLKANDTDTIRLKAEKDAANPRYLSWVIAK